MCLFILQTGWEKLTLILEERGVAWTYTVCCEALVDGVWRRWIMGEWDGLCEDLVDYMRPECMVYDLGRLREACMYYVRPAWIM